MFGEGAWPRFLQLIQLSEFLQKFPPFCPERYLDAVERALAAGDVVLIENLGEMLDPVLGPLLGREIIKKGR